MDITPSAAQDFNAAAQPGQPETPAPTPAAPLRAVFVGEDSLLIRCAEAFMAAGHQSAAICSANPALLQWAQARVLPVQDLGPTAPTAPAAAAAQGASCAPDLREFDFDYLFSVAHLRVLPAHTLARAKRLAINFHDALLPQHAGLNATAWALLGGRDKARRDLA